MTLRLKEDQPNGHTFSGMFQRWTDDRMYEAEQQILWLKTGAMKVALAAGLTLMIMFIGYMLVSL